MTSDKPLHVLKEMNFARFSLQQSLSEYFPFKTEKRRLETHFIFRVIISFYLRTLIIPLLKQITNSIMEILRKSDHTIIDGMQIVYDKCTALEYHTELIFHIFTNCRFTKIL